MRLLYYLFILVIISTCYAQSEEEKAIVGNATTYKVSVADLSRVCINCLRKLLKYGFDSLPILEIPPLDPLYLKEYTIKLDNDHARGYLHLSDIHAAEFSNFNIEAIDGTDDCFKDPTVVPGEDVKEWRANDNYFSAINLALQLETDYDGDLMLMGFVPVFGEGHIDARLDLILRTSMLDIGTSGVQISDFKACLEIQPDPTLGITGLQEDERLSEIIARQLKGLIVEGINSEYKEGISNQLVAIKTVLNKVFGNGLLNSILISVLDPLCGANDDEEP